MNRLRGRLDRLEKERTAGPAEVLTPEQRKRRLLALFHTLSRRAGSPPAAERVLAKMAAAPAAELLACLRVALLPAVSAARQASEGIGT